MSDNPLPAIAVRGGNPDLYALIAANAPGRFGIIDLTGHVDSIGTDPIPDDAQPTTYLPPEVILDRAAFCRRAAQSLKPVTVQGMILGQWTVCTYIPISHHGHAAPKFLYIFSPANVMTPLWGPQQGYHLQLANAHDLGPLHTLTNTELEVLRLLGQGLRSSEMARALHRSVKTVDWRRFRLGQKLGLESRLTIARIAIDCGLASTSDSEFACILRGRFSPAQWPPPDPVAAALAASLHLPTAPRPAHSRPRDPRPARRRSAAAEKRDEPSRAALTGFVA